jgi:PEP-CTERM/exosortase A-associated glycosyltransferase
MLVAKRYNIPFVYEARSNWEDSAVEQGKFKRGDIRYKLGRYMETEVFKESDAVITIARHLQDEIVARGIPQNKVYYIPNGVDGERFQPQDKDTELIDKYKLAGKTVVGFIGSFYAFEGLIYLIKAIPEIMKHMPDARFMIVGDGDEYQNIKNMVKNMNIEEYVYLPGRVSYEDVLRYYSIIDVLVYPRISERLTEFVTPLKPLEAMSMGKLVLGSNVGGIRELIKDGKTGILFNPEDAGSIADKCIMLLKDTDIQDRIRRNVRQVVLEERSWDVLIQKYKEVYRYVLNIATTAKYKPVQ